MLGKLIKQDFKSLSRILFPTQLAILAASIIGTISFAINIRKGVGAYFQNGTFGIISGISAMLGGLMVFAIFASVFLVAFIIFERFYKSFMTSEGYLTFTLPVTTSELLWSKLITAMLWTIISAVVIFISANIFIYFGTAKEGIVNFSPYTQIFRGIREAFSELGGGLTLPIIEFIILCIIGLAYNILHIYLALIIGGIVSQKHKILAGVGFYFVISIAVGIVTSLLMNLFGGAMVNQLNRLDSLMPGLNGAQAFHMVMNATQPMILCSMAFTLILTAGFFLLSNYFIKNKLNLE